MKQKKLVRRKKKIAAAVYEYQADYDGEWGEVEIDFENGTGKISYIAELDTTRSHRYANKATVIVSEDNRNVEYTKPPVLWQAKPGAQAQYVISLI